MKYLIVLLLFTACTKKKCYVCTQKTYENGTYKSQSESERCGLTEDEARQMQADLTDRVDLGNGRSLTYVGVCQ